MRPNLQLKDDPHQAGEFEMMFAGNSIGLRRMLFAAVFLFLATYSYPAHAATTCTLSSGQPSGGGPTAAPVQAIIAVVCSANIFNSSISGWIERDGVIVTSQTLNITGKKSGQLTLSTPCVSGTYKSHVSGAIANAIVNNPFPYSNPVQMVCTPHFSVPSTVVVTEGIHSYALIGVTKNGTSTVEHRVDYTTGGGTATAASDYTPVSGTLIFPPGGTSTRTFQIPLVDDATVETFETIGYALSNPTNGATLGPGNNGAGTSGIVSINDTDIPPGSTITIEGFSVTGGHSYSNHGSVNFAYMLSYDGNILFPIGCAGCVGGPPNGSWVSPKLAMAAYQARMTTDCPSNYVYGNFGSWQPLSTTASWGLSVNEPDVGAFCSMTVEISAITNPSAILDTAVISVGVYTNP